MSRITIRGTLHSTHVTRGAGTIRRGGPGVLDYYTRHLALHSCDQHTVIHLRGAGTIRRGGPGVLDYDTRHLALHLCDQGSRNYP